MIQGAGPYFGHVPNRCTQQGVSRLGAEGGGGDEPTGADDGRGEDQAGSDAAQAGKESRGGSLTSCGRSA